MKELTKTEINNLIASCLLSASRYDTLKDEVEAKKYRDLEDKLRFWCYDQDHAITFTPR